MQIDSGTVALITIGANTLWDMASSDQLSNVLQNIAALQCLNPWQKKTYSERLEDLAQAKLELEQQRQAAQLSEAELCSPASGANQTFKQYLNEVQEQRVGLLRNALLNGVYGDYTRDQREQLYKLVESLQPIDVIVLNRLYQTCRNMDHLTEIVSKSSDISRVDVWQLNSMGMVGCRGEDGKHECKEGGLSQLARELGLPELTIKQSLDRLRSIGLMHNVISTVDFKHPYQGCVPTDGANLLLGFVADPRNGTRQQSTV